VTEVVRAAGGLVVRRDEHGLEVLLVHRPAYGDWTIAKGKLEPGEDEREAAVREVEEETGLRCLVGRELGQTEYRDSAGRPKVVRYWTMAAPTGEAAAANEVDQVRWARPDEAAGLLSYDRDRALLDRLDEAAGGETQRVYLMRHAKAGNRRKWEGPDEERPLTSAGRRQAEMLASLFADAGFAALVSSPYVRCVETLVPLASVLELPVQEHGALAEGASNDDALGLVRAVAALGPVALSTHGDVQRNVVEAVARADAPLEGPHDFAKGSTWILEVHRGEITTVGDAIEAR
jgi:8-oxo-dGTP diphosphatase